MRAKAFMLALAVCALGVAGASAAPPPGKGKPTTGVGCRPQVTVVLKGTLASPPAATSIRVTVTHANKHGQAYAKAAQPTTVLVDPSTTKVRRQGATALATLLAGDRVLVQAKVCKAALSNGATPALTAMRVVAHTAA